MAGKGKRGDPPFCIRLAGALHLSEATGARLFAQECGHHADHDFLSKYGIQSS